MRARQGALRAASWRPLVALAGGLRASGVGVDCQRTRGRKDSYRISRTCYCRAAGFLGVQFWGGGVLWAVTALRGLGGRKLLPYVEAKGHERRKYIISVTRVQVGPRKGVACGSEAHSPASFPASVPPTNSWPCFGNWRFVDEYDMVLDLNVLVAHNP